MNSREKVLKIFNKESNGDEKVMWTGHPSDEIIPILSKKWKIKEEREEIFKYLNDDCRWIMADNCYEHPKGLPIFDPTYGMSNDHSFRSHGCLTVNKESLNASGCFANIGTIEELDKYPWPEVKYLNFDKIYKEIDNYGDKMVLTGMWSPFFHIMADFFGMEEYFVKMYTDPELIEEATKRVVDFYVEANEKFFSGLGNRADAMFFGNDLGTQLDLIISPDLFDKFILPSIKKIISVGKKYNKKIVMHSCGSIYRVIPKLIDAGIDVLHPLQAAAQGMRAEELSIYKGKIAFLGGIDAQTFFVNATPGEIAKEVERVRNILGPNIVISPSHEEILPNVPPENILAMSKAAHS